MSRTTDVNLDCAFVHLFSFIQKLDPFAKIPPWTLFKLVIRPGFYTGIDTDKFKYPIGSARVTFNNYRSYMKAVSAAFIEIKTPKFTKKVQVH